MTKKDNIILLDKEEIEYYNKGKDVEVNSKRVKINVLKTLLNDKFYKRLIELFYSGHYFVKAGLDNGNDVDLLCDLSFADFSHVLNYFLFYGNVTEKQFKRIIKIKEMTSFDMLIYSFRDKLFYMEIDREKYIFKYKDLIEFLTLEDDKYNEIINNNDSIKHYSIENFLYAVKRKFFLSELSFRYNLPTYIKNRILSIKSNEVVDIEAINDIIETDDCKLRKVVLNPTFEKEIMDSIPKDYNRLEKAIFIYIQLCKILTYDPVYFALGKNGGEHDKISKLQSIDKNNNRVVCYEFNSIYGYFLDKLGIHYYATNGDKDSYGNKHASLFFRVGKYIVSADSVTSILAGDLVRAKSNLDLNGIKLVNSNKQSNREFYDALKKVYTNSNNIKVNILKTLRNSIMVSKMSVKERLDYIIEKANRDNLDDIDILGYIFCQRSKVFTQEEKDNIISYTIVRSIEDGKLELKAIFAIKDEETGEYDYYTYSPLKELKKTLKEELEIKFADRKYQYIDVSSHKIPGILDGDEEFKLMHKKINQ